MNEYTMELINLKLSQIHNDILGLHLSVIIDKMHKAGLLPKEDYIEMLNMEYSTISKQFNINTNASQSSSCTSTPRD